MRDLLEAALAVRENAHAPYSRFRVGAALRDEEGRIFVGANVENASYPEGWCAETSAIAAMIAAGGRRIVEAMIVADAPEPITPCGGCRQRLSEFSTGGTVIHSATPAGARARWTMAELLPAGFTLEGVPR